jgi:hypothetical protein
MFPIKAFYWGQRGARENYSLQIRNIVEATYRSLGEIPVIIGECGVPMDMKLVYLDHWTLLSTHACVWLFSKKEAFNTDNWTWQARMMDAVITGLERSLVGFT